MRHAEALLVVVCALSVLAVLLCFHVEYCKGEIRKLWKEVNRLRGLRLDDMDAARRESVR